MLFCILLVCAGTTRTTWRHYLQPPMTKTTTSLLPPPHTGLRCHSNMLWRSTYSDLTQTESECISYPPVSSPLSLSLPLPFCLRLSLTFCFFIFLTIVNLTCIITVVCFWFLFRWLLKIFISVPLFACCPTATLWT